MMYSPQLYSLFGVLAIICCTSNADVQFDATQDRTVPKARRNGSLNNHNVLLISFDSFGWDYFDLVDTPVLNSFKKYGAYAKHTINVVPTVTFPNHISLATGLYPESHGIVANSIYDPNLNDTFHMPVTDPKWWWNDRVEPIWTTNEKQGGVSGVCIWPGSNIKGYMPTYYADREGKYDIPFHAHHNRMPYQVRVDTVISWLQGDKPPNFMMLYFGLLDHEGHKHGFGSRAALHEVASLDNITGYLLDQLSKHNLLDKWNIIITADHGMTNISDSRVIDITKYIDISDIKLFDAGGVVFVWSPAEKTQEVYKNLTQAHPNMTVYLKDDFPEKFHLKNNVRVSPILITVDEGWQMDIKQRNISEGGGAHGYLNTYPSMWPIFLARGPAFKKGYLSPPFESVNVYTLICQILNIKPQPNNGTLGSIMNLLVEHKFHSQLSWDTWSPIKVGILVAVGFFVTGMIIFAIAMCCSHRKLRKMGKKSWKTKVVMSENEQSNRLLNDYDDNDNEEIYNDNEEIYVDKDDLDPEL